MRSDNKTPFAGDEIVLRLAGLPAVEMERRVRAYRARVIAELMADALIWIARLPRRLADAIELGGRKQGA